MPQIQILDIDMPHCQHCGTYCKMGTKGRVITLGFTLIRLCNDCFAQLHLAIDKNLERAAKEESRSDDGARTEVKPSAPSML